MKEMYCERRFSVFKKGWVQLLYGPFESKKRLNVGTMRWEEQGVPLAQSASPPPPPPHWFTAETRQQIKSGLTRKLKRRPGNGLEVARGKQHRSNHLLLLSSYTE